MVEANYDPESEYHTGSIAEQEAKAQLGVFKCIEEVPSRYYLGNFKSEVDADEAWKEFCDDVGSDWTENTRKYRYGTPWRSWCDFCEERDLHPALPDPADVDEWLEQEQDTRTPSTCHDLRYRPLFMFFDWMLEHPDYPHRYSPVLMTALLGGAGAEIWKNRVMRRKKYGGSSK